ncbi:MAG: hypothetical protein IJB70_11375, partial [Clostridia bacterium]|nr:hypothetical protein [Clostridia bacterium]
NILSLLDGSIRKYSADTNSRALYEPILEKLGDARTKIEDVYLEGIGKKKSSGLNSERFSLVNIVGKKNNYGTGVFLDTNLFDNKHPRLWSGILRKYVEDNFPGKTIETYKDNGEKELIYFAKKNERVKKDGAKNSHKVIGDLSNPKGNIEKLAVVHIDELLQAPYSQEFKDENSHQWLDENGWDIRTVYLVDKNNKIYEAKLNIGNARDGRKIIYKISNVKSIDTVGKGFTVIQRELNDGSFQNWSMPKKSIPQDSSVVKKNSLPLKEPPTGEVTSDAPKAADFKTQTNPLTFRRGEADIEYGRTFQFEDNSQPSKVKDAYNQSLHLSDSVIVSTGYNYSAGRILSFNADGTVKVAIDSSLDIERKNYNVDPKQLLFVAHNDAKTVSENYNGDYNLYYNKLKETFENYFETGIINESDFEMPELQYCLNSLTHKRNMLTARLNNIFKERIDRGVATEVKESGFEVYSDEFEKDTAFASLPDEKKDEQSPVFNYGRLSEQSTALQLYDTVMTYNLAYELSEVYRANGLDTIDYGKIFDNAVDIDRVLPLKKKTNSSGSEVKFAKKNAYRNGTYMFNDFKRNLERVFGKHYKDIKFVYEHLQTAKGNYGRNIDLMRIALQQAMKTYNIKPGSIEDKVVQWYGEGEIAPNLNNKKEVKMLNELGFDVSVSSDPDVTIKFTDADLIRIFGEERAEDIKGFSQFFRKMYDSYVERVNATIAGIYPGDTDKLLKPRKDYFRHFREMGSYMEYLGQTFLEDFQISPELSGKSHATKPKRSWESFMQTRKGKRTSASAIKGFIDYVYSAEYTININPQIKEIREFSQWIRNHKIRTDSSDLNTFIRYLDTYANLLSKKTIGLDRSIADLEWTDGRKTLKILGVINNHLKSNAVMLNASTSLKQVFNVPNALNYLNHSYKLPLAVMGLAKSGVDAKLRKKYHDLFDKSDFLTERYAKSNLDKLVASKGKRALDMLVSAGDEFGCKAVWLAAYQDGLSAKVPNPFLYADDIAKKCCAGRGVGDVPIAFEQQTMKLFLPFLLEANNLRNVYRDAVFNYENTGDVNSYMAVRAGKGKVAQKLSRFSKLALFMFATCALNDLAEEMFGQRVNPDFIDNVRKSFDAALDENGGEFNARTISNGLWNTARYSVGDYLDMSNFGHFGYQLLSLFGEDPLGDAYYDSGVNMPVISTFLDIGKSFKNSKDWEKDGLAEAGFKLFSYMLPAGGSQLRKSFYGLTDYSRGGKYEYGPFASALNDGQLGSKKFDIEKSPENFVKSALFGTSSLDESKDYYNQLYIDRVSREKAADAKEDAFDAFYHDYVTEHGQDEFIKLSKELGDTSVLPFSYVPDSIQYTDFDGNPLSVDFSADERKSYQNNLNELISDEFITVSKSSAYKNADSAGKAHLLSEAKTKVVSEFNSGLRDKFKYAEVFDEYVAAHGEDDIARIVREKENYKILPFYKIDSEKEYNINGEKTVIKFSDEEIDSYSGLAQERIDNSYNDLLNSEGWDMLSDEEKSEKLMDARSKAISEVNDIIRDDYVFADVLDNYVASHGENDVVKFVKNSRNYEYLPHYEPERNKKYTLNGNEFSFELTDDQINKYSLLANEKMEASYSNLMESSEWNLLSDEEKSEKLLEARANVKSEINDFIKYDYVYKDAITDFDNKYGADNPVRQAYEYSHDATVYPYWELDDKITFTYQKVDYEYTLSKDYDPKRGKSEYDEWMEYYNGKLISNYVDNAIGKGYLQGKSPEEIYDTLSTYKADIRKNMLNVQLRNYAKGKLGLGTQSFQRVVV